MIRNNHTTAGQPSWGLGINRQNNGVRALLLGSDDANNAAIAVNGDQSLTFGKEVAGVWTERVRIDFSGRLLVGTSSTLSNAEILQVNSTNPANVFGVYRQFNDTTGPRVYLGKTRGSATSIVQNGDTIADIRFVASDGVDIASQAASITAFVDGTPGANDMPGRLMFSTTADGASSPTERMRISSNGLVTLSANAGLSVSKISVTSPAATDGNVFSGTYLPTITNTTNVASSIAVTCQYMRVGKVVTISGQFSVQATTGGVSFTLGMSLPIASGFTLQRQAAGSFSAGSAALTMNFIAADATNDRLVLYGIMADTNNRICSFHATYQIV